MATPPEKDPMEPQGVPVKTTLKPGRAISSFLTEQLRPLLEQRSLRIGAIGVMLVAASLVTLVPTPGVVDSGWMFIVPVAISAIAGGLKEGLVVALAASGLCALYTVARTGVFDESLVLSVVAARFALYGITASVLGAFAEAHYAVQSNLRTLAATDPLTKVANISRFYEELGLLEQAMSDFAVVLIDVDELKAVNDRHGHMVGSAAIQAVANALRKVVRGTDCVARYGGDEFVVILRGADQAGARIVVNRLEEVLAAEVLPGAPDERVKVSTGVALYGEDGITAEELLRAADKAMYSNKRARKSA